jgi:hypothetical protein
MNRRANTVHSYKLRELVGKLSEVHRFIRCPSTGSMWQAGGRPKTHFHRRDLPWKRLQKSKDVRSTGLKISGKAVDNVAAVAILCSSSAGATGQFAGVEFRVGARGSMTFSLRPLPLFS